MLRKFLLAVIMVFGLFPFLMADCVAHELSIEDIVKINSDSIVLVGTLGPKGSSLGSGFIVSPDGLVITNLHILQQAMKIEVRGNNKRTYTNVQLVKFDNKKDIAILKIDAHGLRPVALGDSEAVRVGEKVVAIGNPLGLESTVSDGLISSLRQVDRGFELLQITTPISPGSSGGPLFNLRGEVIGVTVGTNVNGQNINFAIPINYAKRVLNSYNRHSRYEGHRYHPGSFKTLDYRVKPGDTLFSLARRFNTDVQALMRLNGLISPAIFTGQKIKIPL